MDYTSDIWSEGFNVMTVNVDLEDHTRFFYGEFSMALFIALRSVPNMSTSFQSFPLTQANFRVFFLYHLAFFLHFIYEKLLCE